MPNRKLDENDRALIEELRTLGVLGNHIPERVNVADGVILMCCSDGDQFDVVMDHMRDTAIQAGVRPRIHTIANHGGALLVSPDCPLFTEHRIPHLMMLQLRQAREMKEIHSIVLSVHAPCGAAGMAYLNVVELIQHMMDGKQAVKDHLMPNIKVLCVLFVDFGNGDKQSFTVARKDWNRYMQSRSVAGQVVCVNDSESCELN